MKNGEGGTQREIYSMVALELFLTLQVNFANGKSKSLASAETIYRKWNENVLQKMDPFILYVDLFACISFSMCFSSLFSSSVTADGIAKKEERKEDEK